MANRITIGRSAGRKVWLDPVRRSTHLHVIGGSGMGKTKFLEHMIREDILAGHGACLIDPHGDLYRNLVDWCSAIGADKFTRIHLIDPSQDEWCTGFNPLARFPDEKPLDRVDSMLEALAQVWGGGDAMDTPSIRTMLRAVLTILIKKGQTLAEAFPLTRLDDDDAIREYLVAHIDDPVVREVWDGYQRQAQKAPREFLIEFGGPRRRLFELLHDENLRHMFGQVDNAVDFRQVMDRNEVVLVNLSENALDERRAQALGALLVREMFLVAKRRNIETAERNPFYLYIDECAQYLTADISKLLAQTRKFGLHVTLAHQWLEQLRNASPDIFAAVMAIQNKVVFGGLSDIDADIIAQELFRTEYDIEMPVELLIKPTVVGVVQTWLHHWSESSSEGEVNTESATQTADLSASVSQLFDPNGFPIGGYTGTTASAAGGSTSQSNATSVSRGRSEGASEAYIPEFRNLPSAVHSLENVKHLAMARLRSLPERHAIVKGTAIPSFEIVTYPTHPKVVAPESHASFKARLLASSPYALPATRAQELIEQRREATLAEVGTWRSPSVEDEAGNAWRGPSP
ncbi:MAG: type IV secretion system DNA-binding domain-containing protein [Fimbriimonadaceae bacterium]|nr:type IV secretion system DNA-binding domain-containing protein [Alphaproteobacteria bacterium]